jgi:hypothetical protein
LKKRDKIFKNALKKLKVKKAEQKFEKIDTI